MFTSMVQKLFSKRKGQAVGENNGAGAAFFILILTLLIVIYILFLPPADRAALLDDNIVPGNPPTSSGGYSHLVGSIPLNQYVGHVDYISDAEITHDLASFRIYTQTDATIINSEQSMYIKKSAFETKTKTINFRIDPSASENLKLSFNVLESSGDLSIYLNSVLIFEGFIDEGSPLPIEFAERLLKQDNVLHFSVSTPGFAFWRVHEYRLHNVRITGDVTDSSNSFHMQKFYLSDAEYNHMKSAEFSFFPDCEYQTVGNLMISLNSNQIYFGTADCGITNRIMFGKEDLKEGENKIEFVSEEGSYIIDMPEIEVKLEDPEYPIYYFDLNEDLFTYVNSETSFCGKIDGVCPENCNTYDDKDCCFDESNQNYWCDVDTNNPHDRCVNTVLASYVGNCDSGYEDHSGDPHSSAVGDCGDDTDGFCPTGCNPDYDKDCCYASSQGAFWCSDIPFTGTNSVCTPVVTPAECDSCPDGYFDESNQQPNCPSSSSGTTPTFNDQELKAGVDIILQSFFADNSYKKVDYVINGNKLPIDTYATQFDRNINPLVKEGINSIIVQPRRDLNLAQLRVVVQ